MADEVIAPDKNTRKWMNNTIGYLFTILGILSIGTLFTSNAFQTDGNVFLSTSKLTVYLILILAGILYIKMQDFSRWLLVCTIPIFLVKPLGYILLAIFHLFSGTFEIVIAHFYPGNLLLLFYISSHFLLSILLILHLVHWKQDFYQSNDKGIYLVSKILAFLSPGLGSVAQGKLWIGFAFYFIYISLQSILNSNRINCSAGDSCLEEKIILILLQIAIWSGFNKFDSDYIDNTTNKAKPSLHEDLTSLSP